MVIFLALTNCSLYLDLILVCLFELYAWLDSGLFHSWLDFLFQPHTISDKWRLAFLAASFSMILSVATASEEVKAKAFNQHNLKKALKTESDHLGHPRTLNPNDPKTIDYTLYNYGKFLLLTSKPHKQNCRWQNYSAFKLRNKKEILLFCALRQIRLIRRIVTTMNFHHLKSKFSSIFLR